MPCKAKSWRSYKIAAAAAEMFNASDKNAGLSNDQTVAGNLLKQKESVYLVQTYPPKLKHDGRQIE